MKPPFTHHRMDKPRCDKTEVGKAHIAAAVVLLVTVAYIGYALWASI